MFVTNTAANPIPVREQNVDTNGNVKVAQQGTANVREQNVDANGNLKVHEQGTVQAEVTGEVATRPTVPSKAFTITRNVGGGGTILVHLFLTPEPLGTRFAVTTLVVGNETSVATRVRLFWTTAVSTLFKKTSRSSRCPGIRQ